MAQSCEEYKAIIEAVQPTYKSMEEHSESITGVWFNRSYIVSEEWENKTYQNCEQSWNFSKYAKVSQVTFSAKFDF